MRIKKFNTYISENKTESSINLITNELDKRNIKFELRDDKIIVNGLDYDISGHDDLLNEILSDLKIT